MSATLDFQSIIFKLQTYWSGQGCLIWQPYYSQVGAGTMNPATFLRVLGPEPWKVAYLEPSVRPDDGRYGINPNRLQQHYQFQVILKPDPGNPQELYLNSLLAIGIDPQDHDIRFVEDNWESPALSAWGLGWEVWLDGQEITQFTYFQQSGGVVLDVPSVEITYGLERIAMTLQRVRDFKQINWNGHRHYGDVYQVAEREHSTYYYEVAGVENLHQMFKLYVSEAESALERGLVLPAYDNIIKCSHTFNVLDARGAVGFTERQGLFAKMRELSRRVAEAYLAQRKEMGFPWLEESPVTTASAKLEDANSTQNATEDFLFELGTEEIPVGELRPALDQLQKAFEKLLDEQRLSYVDLDVQGTPRRLSVQIKGLQTAQADRVVEVKGPPADRAFNPDGSLSATGLGFAKSRGVDPSALGAKDFPNGRYVVLEMAEKGRRTAEILAEALPQICKSLKFSKSMRWNASGVAFTRPVRTLLALLGAELIPFSFAGLQSDRITRGLRFSSSPEAILACSGDYLPYLRSEGIQLNVAERRADVWEQALAVAGTVGGHIAKDEALLDEVANLVERPCALLGAFEQRYLNSLPPEVLIGVMKKHQRYFPVLDEQGNLSRYFVIMRNGSAEGAATVVDGNLQVVHARFADAEFFIKEDREKKIEDFLPGLEQLTFQKALGSMLDKTHRVENLTRSFSEQLGLSAELRSQAERVAQLCKADLASAMVVEMTALQGVMGKYYALNSGESPAVAEGIFEHYLPRSSEDSLPSGEAGLVVGLADRLDSIAGLFAVGLAPTGNKDPFALRRTAMGLVQILMSREIDFELEAGLRKAAAQQPVEVPEEQIQNALQFIVGRMHGLLLERGYRYDVVDAVEQALGHNPAQALKAVSSLQTWTERADWTEILQAYSRSVRITRELTVSYTVQEDLLVEADEKELLAALTKAESSLSQNPGIEPALVAVQGLVETIQAFFSKVLVMAKEDALRETRLGLLQRVASLLSPYADISRLEGF